MEHPGARAWPRWSAAGTRGIPVGVDRDRGLERRVDVHRVPRRGATSRIRRRRPAPARRLHVPGRRRMARSEGDGRRAARRAASRCCSGRSRSLETRRIRRAGRRRRRAHDGCERGYCRARGATARPYRNRGWWFPRCAACPTSRTRDATRLVDSPSAATSSRRSASTASRPTAASTRGATTCSYADGTPRRRDEQPLSRARTREAYGDLLAPVRLRSPSAAPASPARGAGPCHWAGDEDSTWEAFRASITAGLSAASCGVFFWGWDLAGFSGEVPTPSCTCAAAAHGRLRARSCSTTPSSTTIARRRATARRGTSPSRPGRPA